MPAHVVKVHPENLWRRHFWNRYRGLLPVATMLEKLGFQALVEETLRCMMTDLSVRCDGEIRSIDEI